MNGITLDGVSVAKAYRNEVFGTYSQVRDRWCDLLDGVTRGDDVPQPRPPSLDPTYWPALDGLRAVAVLMVVGYHARLTGFARGDLGVDVFFVLSGFLITSLIVSEMVRTGAFSFRRFYARRFVRLFPAYFLVLVGCLVVSGFGGYGGTSRGAVLSFVYLANWGAATGAGLGLLRHTWSLSIEEQFYVVWPITVAALIALLRGRLVALLVAVSALVLASYATALVLLADGVSPTWISNATPTRAGMLLAGAVLAIGLSVRVGRSGRVRRGVDVAGWLGLVALVLISSDIGSTALSPIAVLWPLVVVATLAVVAASVLVPNGSLARVLGRAPLVWIGRRSYGIYLWHFPVFVIADVEFGGLGPVPVLGATALSLALAAVCYTYVETPLIAAARRRSGRSPSSVGRAPRPLSRVEA